ncbi:hypothetical protein [Methanoregula sp. PtaB.Bin085]|uniref:hypothetical protein n=1 Tax=Methanoregula sp. PtaB.Bin085 TaxID=1811680 RepID=UPI0025EAA0B5|nr:hypothetical protein [Methanoregula sp. PtaB.Bin085]
MPEDTHTETRDIPDSDDITPLHTCVCGEQHWHRPGSRSHRDECTSPKKFGESCCCAPGPAGKANRHHCGHGPRCQ